MNKEGALKLALDRFDTECQVWNDEYNLMQRDLEFATNYNGCQWDEQVRQERENDPSPRPCLVINKIKEKIDIVTGEFREMRPSFKISPVDSAADPVIADIYNGLIKNIEYSSNARMSYNNAFNSVLFSGMGHWRIDIIDDKDDPFVRNITINPVTDSFSVYWDPFAKRYDKKDARYVFVIADMPIKEFEQKFPDVSTEGWQDKMRNTNTNSWLTGESVRVAEYWFKNPEEIKYHKVMRNDNFLVVEDKDLDPIDQILESKIVKRDKIFYGKLIHDQWIEGPFADWPIDNFPIIFCGGKYNFLDGLMRYHGMVRYAIDPQQMYNYWTSTITESVALQPKSPYLITSSTLSNPEYKRIWDQSDKRNFPYLPIDIDQSGFVPQRQAPPQVSSGLANELDRTNSDIMSTMGIYSASLGDTGPEKSGLAISARQRQGSIGSYLYMDNFSLSLTHSIKIIVDLIPFVYDTMRQIRILGPDQAEKVVMINAVPQYLTQTSVQNLDPKMHRISPNQVINELSVGKYDVQVTMGASHATQRQENTELMISLLQTMPNMADMIAPILIKNVDNPAAQEITKLLEERKNMQPAPDPLLELSNKQLEMSEARKMKELELKAFREAKNLELKERIENQRLELDELKAIVEVLKSNLTTQQLNKAEQDLNLN